jgi:hypothetical protein
MNFLDYLYNKYYYFQVKVGNADIAPFSALVFLFFIFSLYILGLFFYTGVIIGKDNFLVQKMEYIFCSIEFSLFFCFIIRFFTLKKSSNIIKNKEFIHTSHWPAIIFSVFGFLFLFFAMYLGLLQNRGEI